MRKYLQKFSSKAAFNRAKSSLPTPCVAKITSGSNTLMFYRDTDGKEHLHTVGAGSVVLGESLVGGKSKL